MPDMMEGRSSRLIEASLVLLVIGLLIGLTFGFLAEGIFGFYKKLTLFFHLWS